MDGKRHKAVVAFFGEKRAHDLLSKACMLRSPSALAYRSLTATV